MTDTVCSSYDLLESSANVQWTGNSLRLKRPQSLHSVHRVNFRSFIGDLLPFTNLTLPNLKCEVIMTSNGLTDKDIIPADNVYTPELINYGNIKINKLIEFSKEWTYQSSEESQLLYNIKECLNECNYRLNVAFPFIGKDTRYNIDTTEKLEYSANNVNLCASYGSAFNYYNATSHKFCVNSAGSEVEVFTENDSYDYKLFASNATLNQHIIIYEDNGTLYFEGKCGANSIAKTAINSNAAVPSCIFFHDVSNDYAVVGDKIVINTAVKTLELSGTQVDIADLNPVAAGVDSNMSFWMMAFIEGDPTSKCGVYFADWHEGVPDEPTLLEDALNESSTYDMEQFNRIRHGGETFGNVQNYETSGTRYLYWQGSACVALTHLSTTPEVSNPSPSIAYLSDTGEYYQTGTDGTHKGFKKVIAFDNSPVIWAARGVSSYASLDFDDYRPLKSFTNNYGVVQLDDWNGPWTSLNPNMQKNAYRCDTVPYRELKSDGMINATSGGYATDYMSNMMTIAELGIEDDNTIVGKISTTEISYASDKVINLALRIYTDPYWFEIYTPIEYFASVHYSLSHPELTLAYNPVNEHILNTIELLLIMKYEYNDLTFKCFQFPNTTLL